MSHRLRLILSSLLLTVGSGCATPGPRSEFSNHCSSHLLDSAGPAVAVDSRPHPRLDRIEHFLNGPRRWFRDAEELDAEVSQETLDLVTESLQAQGLCDVHVTLNAYSPHEEWCRLQANTDLPEAWRYSVGTCFWLRSTMVPDRVLNKNVYYPNSNTLALNAEDPFDILSEIAYARRLREGRVPIMARTLPQLPVLSSVSRIQASREVLAEAKTEGHWEIEQAGYTQVYSCVMSLGFETVGLATSIPFYLWIPAEMAGDLCATRLAKLRIAQRVHERKAEQILQASASEDQDQPAIITLE